jgi:alpha-L-rhamnosidase
MNHYAFGAVGSFLFESVAGIRIDEDNPGFKHIIIQPEPGGGLTHAKARLESVYGLIESGWRREDKKTVVEVTIPPNTWATVKLPGARIENVREGGRKLGETEGVSGTAQEGDRAIVRVGSGRYSFEYGN